MAPTRNSATQTTRLSRSVKSVGAMCKSDGTAMPSTATTPAPIAPYSASNTS
jgi:hypothetical protein